MPKDSDNNNIYPLFGEEAPPPPPQAISTHPSAMSVEYIKEVTQPVLENLDARVIARTLLGEDCSTKYKFLESSEVAVFKDEYMAYLNRHNTNAESSNQFDIFRSSNEQNLATVEEIISFLEGRTLEGIDEGILEKGVSIINYLVTLFAEANEWQKEDTELVIRVLDWNLKHNINRVKLWERYLELSRQYCQSKKESYDHIATVEGDVE